MYNVLVCDDDREIVEAIEIYLSQEGYKVLKAYDGEEALKVLDREKVDLLIIDVMMPKLDGIRATLKIREKKNMPDRKSNLKNPGREQYANHCAVSKDSRFRQDSRIECRSG